MARTSLRKRVEALAVDAALRVPKDYEEGTIRNVATRTGKATGRIYSVVKNTETKTFTIIRTA